MTVVRAAIRTTLIPVTVGTFETIRHVRGVKLDDSYEDGGIEASKTTIITRMATPRGSIPDCWHF